MASAYNYEGTFEQYMDLFIGEKLSFGSYFFHLKVRCNLSSINSKDVEGVIQVANFIQSGWARKDHPNLMFLWYEDMKKDLIKVIRDVCKFTGHHLTDYKVLVLDDALYIDNFRSALGLLL